VAGCTSRARHVDHVMPVAAAPHRRLDPTNLQSLCHAHHNIVTKAFDADTLRGACDSDGNPLDPQHPWAQKDSMAAIKAANAEPAADPKVAARLKRRFVKGER
jgi:hypothetical protein